MAITLKLNTGATLTLRETIAKSGNTFLAVRPASEPIVSRFGFNVPASLVGGKLPTSADVMDGNTRLGTIRLSKGQTSNGNVKVSGNNTVSVTVDGVEQTLKIERISSLTGDRVNVLIRSARPNGKVHTSL